MTAPIPPQRQALGTVGLIISIIGFGLACNARSMSFGWGLLAVAFILGIAGLTQSGNARKKSTAAIVISVAGAVVSVAIVAFSVSHLLFDLFRNLLVYIFGGPSPPQP